MLFADKIYNNDGIIFSNEDYTEVVIHENDFAYLNPPYFITTESYNKSWNENEEKILYPYLQKLNDAGIKRAMSNVLKNNGREHNKAKELRTRYPDNEYKHVNFRRKNKEKTIKVLITN